MRLVVDCFKLVKGSGKSIGIYNLAQSLVEHLAAEKGSRQIVVLGNAHNRKDFDLPGVTFVEMKYNPLNKLFCIYWELFLVVREAKKQKADRILFPRGFRPLFCGIKDTIIIHDLIPFYYHKQYPDTFNKLENGYIMNRLKASIKGADSVVTISKYSKKEIDEICPGCEKKTTVIYNGYNNVTCGAPVKRERPYLYATTSGLPHKNAAGILKAYDAYYQQAKEPLDLVLIGIPGTEGYAISPEAAAHVECHKFIPKFEDMCSLLKGARAFLFLSYMEGFGFPPLEAMQLEVPVVCSDRSSLPEVVGDAGILVDPDNIPQVVEGLNRVISDETLREELIRKGKENGKRFGWDTRTKQYWKVLEK